VLPAEGVDTKELFIGEAESLKTANDGTAIKKLDRVSRGNQTGDIREATLSLEQLWRRDCAVQMKKVGGR
jgi:hypothetical protein